MYSKLKKYKGSKKLVAIYSNKNERENFSVGYIQELTQEKAIILNIGIHGEYDGYAAIYIDDIYRLEIDNKYLGKIAVLQDLKMEKILPLSITDDFFYSIIKESINKERIIAINYGEEYEEIRGYVTKINNFISLMQINEYGEADGETVIDMRLINKVVIDDVECREIERLYRYSLQHV